ncbi:IS91 family transposase [Arsenophonus sp. PmNCSU2021_1]|uniref:IS91 family transposase n=1 Tax=Arsenophonus sp. PmNCSU2021_1 TaxID=3118989 RepID=UPI002FF1F26B
MSPRFSHVFQFGQRWLNWLNRQPPNTVRPVVMQTMVKIMACGTSLMGWSIWRCPDPECNHEKWVKFTCKSRSCPHCGVKACLQWINNTLAWLPKVPWQHITFTMPGEYWPVIRANRWLLGEMNRLAADVVLTICRDLNITPGIFTAIHTWGRDQKWHPHIHLSTTAGGVTKNNTWRDMSFYRENVMTMWQHRITESLRKHYYTLTIPDELKCEGRSKFSWNRLLNTHYKRGWNINLSNILSNITHVTLYLRFYLKKAPVSLSRLKHYAGEDNITLRYKSHRTKKQEDEVITSDELITRFESHVPQKWFHIIRYYGFLSPSAPMRKMLTEVVYPLIQQDHEFRTNK